MSEQELKPVEEMAFDEAMAELERVNARLEGNFLGLEESLEAFERGVALLKAAKLKLDTSQQRVTQIMGELAGQMADDERDTTIS